MSSCCTLLEIVQTCLCRHMDTCREPCVRPPVSDKIYIAWTPLGVFLLPCFTVGSTHCVSFTLLLLSIIACWDLSVIILSTLVFSIIHCEMLVYVRPAWECFPLLRSGLEALLNLRWGGSDVATILYADWILVLYLASLDLVYKLQMLHDRRWCYWDAEDNLKQSQCVNTSKTTLSLLPK